ncbi:hypothetical protein [Shimia aestuarii]|uniref:hypothetical protein n=1 Tax=Shimia aestuarii TaxID=254406 RepID=UPI001FB3D126|nr:hypothetical protein [Shimia aestuarii]
MVARDEEWGPWIEHDGRGIPVPVGTVVNVLGSHGSDIMDIIRDTNADIPSGATTAWHWSFWPAIYLRKYEHVTRYRIRKPRGMQILEGLLEQIDAPKPVEVPA